MHVGQVLRALVLAFGFATAFVSATAPMSIAYAQTPKPEEGVREGAQFIVGRWNFTGAYSDGQNDIGFWADFRPDGTFVDRDNYPGRWVISGSSFSMFYPDESQLGYVGVIENGRVSGRFDGATTSGVFEMSR